MNLTIWSTGESTDLNHMLHGDAAGSTQGVILWHCNSKSLKPVNIEHGKVHITEGYRDTMDSSWDDANCIFTLTIKSIHKEDENTNWRCEAALTLCKKASNHHANLPLETYSFTL